MKSFSKTKLKSKPIGCCNRRQFIAATAFLGGSANLIASDSPVVKYAESGTEISKAAPVHIPYASICMKSPNSALFGITPMKS